MLRLKSVGMFVLFAPSILGALQRPTSPLDVIETLRGPIEIKGEASNVFVTLRDGQDRSIVRSFIVQTEQRLLFPLSVSADSSQVRLWRGHLFVALPGEREALHFFVPSTGDPGEPRGHGTVGSGAKSASQSLESMVGWQVEDLRSFRAAAIISRSGPAALVPAEEWLKEDDNQDYGSGGGSGSCGTSCSQSCADGSSCSVTCVGGLRCAHCSCPASCSCS